MRYLIVAQVNEGFGDRLHLEFIAGAQTADQAAAEFLDREHHRGTLVSQYAVISGLAVTVDVTPRQPLDHDRVRA